MYRLSFPQNYKLHLSSWHLLIYLILQFLAHCLAYRKHTVMFYDLKWTESWIFLLTFWTKCLPYFLAEYLPEGNILVKKLTKYKQLMYFTVVFIAFLSPGDYLSEVIWKIHFKRNSTLGYTSQRKKLNKNLVTNDTKKVKKLLAV